MGWDVERKAAIEGAKRTAEPIVQAIEDFNKSSSELSQEMVKLGRKMNYLTGIIIALTIIMVIVQIVS